MSTDDSRMTGAPALTVAMSVYNNAPFLTPAIESILGQSFEDFEFLIVNDGSSDGSDAIIDSFAARDSRIRPIHQANAGLVASLNRLIREARAPLIARMDGDDLSMPERFARQIAFLDANPDHGVVGTWTMNIDEQGHIAPSAGLDHPTDHEGFLDALDGKPLLCHPSAMMRTELVRAAGGYRAQYAHCEDYDLWLRLSETTRLCSLPERLLHYRYSEAQVSNKHVMAQSIGAAVAWWAHLERLAGRPDPTEGISTLPPLNQIDALFGRKGIADEIRAWVAPRLLYSDIALAGSGYDMLVDYIRAGGSRDGMWRTVARMVTWGLPLRALKLATVLARS